MLCGRKRNNSLVYPLPDYQTEVKRCDVALLGSPCFQLIRSNRKRVNQPLPQLSFDIADESCYFANGFCSFGIV